MIKGICRNELAFSVQEMAISPQLLKHILKLFITHFILNYIAEIDANRKLCVILCSENMIKTFLDTIKSISSTLMDL